MSLPFTSEQFFGIFAEYNRAVWPVALTWWLAAAGVLVAVWRLTWLLYPATPTFGVPCPTDILTIGVLLTVRGGVPLSLAIVPVLWGFVGGSAALMLGVQTDYVLLAAGAVLAVVEARRATAPG